MVSLSRFWERKWIKEVLRILRFFSLGVAVFWMVRFLYSNWQEIILGSYHFDLFYIFLGFFINFILLILMAFGWILSLRIIGINLSVIDGTRIYYRTSLLRYLPGSVWNFPGRGYLSQKYGISLAQFTQSVFLEQFFLLGTGILIACWRLSDYLKIPWLFVITIAIFFITIIAILFSDKVTFLPFPDLLKIKVNNLSMIPRVFCNYLVVWVCYGLEVYLLIHSFTNIQLDSAFNVISSNAGAWLIGFVSLSPVGLGVREVSLSALLGESVIGPIVVLVSLFQRFLETILELALWVFFTFNK